MSHKTEIPKLNEKRWFKPVRGSYLPESTAGWLTYIPFVGYLIFSSVVGVVKASSVFLAVLIVVPNWVAAGIVLTYIAIRKS